MKSILRHIVLMFVLTGFPRTLVGTEGSATIIFSNYDLEKTLFLDRITVQRIFTRRETHWSNGDNIIVFIKPMDSLEHRHFVTEVLNMTLYRYQKSLESYTYTAKALPVTEVPTDQKMLNAIHTHPGAIGYVNYEIVINDKIIHICDDGCL